MIDTILSLLTVGYHFDMWHKATGSVMRLTCGYELERGESPLFFVRQRKGRKGRIDQNLYVSDNIDDAFRFWLAKVGRVTDTDYAIGNALRTSNYELRVRDTGDTWRRELVFDFDNGKDTENVGLSIAPFYIVRWFEVSETSYSGKESVTTSRRFWDSSESFKDAMKIFTEQLQIMVAEGL